jgi:hypothetical protein
MYLLAVAVARDNDSPGGLVEDDRGKGAPDALDEARPVPEIGCANQVSVGGGRPGRAELDP